MKDSVLDALDLRLIDALQHRPRASWTSLAQKLGSSAVTLSRRWDALVESGAAWMTVNPNFLANRRRALSLGLAIVELQVRNGDVLSTAEDLAARPEIASLEIVSGDRDLMLVVVAGGPPQLSSLILGTLEQHASVVQVRTHPVTSTHADSSTWHLRSAGTGDSAIARGAAESRQTLPKPDLAEAIAALLGADGRAPASAVAKELGISVPAARAALARTIGSGLLRFRVEVSRASTRWPVHVWHFIRSAPSRRLPIAAEIGKLPETRVVLGTMGNADLATVAWLQSLADVQELEESFERLDPHMSVQDRVLVLRTCKSMGKLLDEEGQARGYVPLPAYFGPH